jgi:hypothetical protein
MMNNRYEALRVALEALEGYDTDPTHAMKILRPRAIRSIKAVLEKPSAEYERGYVDGLQARKNKNSFYNIGKALVGKQKHE